MAAVLLVLGTIALIAGLFLLSPAVALAAAGALLLLAGIDLRR